MSLIPTTITGGPSSTPSSNAPAADRPFSPSDPRILTPSDWQSAAETLTEAFADDHVSRYFLDTPDRAHWPADRKHALHRDIMYALTLAHVQRGLGLASGAADECVALWMPPGCAMDDWAVWLSSGLWRLEWSLSREGRARFADEFLPALAAAKRRILGARESRAYYLVYLGTLSSARGQGLGRRSMEWMLARADAEGAPCYLESSSDANRRLYGRLGFVSKGEIRLTRDEHEDVVMEAMVREPVASRQDAERMNGVLREVEAEIEVEKEGRLSGREKVGTAGVKEGAI